MTENFDLKGKVALVTGAAGGIGRAVSMALADAGAIVVGTDVVINKTSKAIEKKIEDAGGTAVFRKLDVSDYDAVREFVRVAAKEFGGLHVLVNNAGVTADQMLGRMKPEQWKRVIEVNLGGCYNCCRAAARIMIRQRQGRIINISSVVARIGRVGQANYAASKAGIEGLTRSSALELAHRNITVNAVAPGFIDTQMTRPLPEKIKKKILENIPLGRTGSPEDVADLVLFLAGSGAAYITGQTIQINGGLYFG